MAEKTEGTLPIEQGGLAASSIAPGDGTSKEELTQFLKFLREQAEAGLTNTKAFVGEQAPLVVQELIAYKRATASIWLIVPLLLAVAMAKFWKMAHNNEYPEGSVPCCLLGTAATIAVFAYTWQAAAMVWFAPRLVVINYLRRLL